MIPKSLHTITALANVARNVLAQHPDAVRLIDDPAKRADWAVGVALAILGYADADDTYNLRAKAAATIATAAPTSTGRAGRPHGDNVSAYGCSKGA